MGRRYVIVTPVRNEERFLPRTVESVLRQDILPLEWIIINDHSTDGTGRIIAELAAGHCWVTPLDYPDDGPARPRRMGGEEVLPYGLKRVEPRAYDYIVRMDGDLIFPPDFFTRLFAEFERDPSLGIASGVCHVHERGGLREEKHPGFHTRGPMKVYRSQCYLDIDGIDHLGGWDTIDEIRANMRGWRTRSLPALKIIHQRRTQTASGALRGRRNMGRVAYRIGYHPLYALLRAARTCFRRPYVVGGLSMMYGFLEGYWLRSPRVEDKKLIEYLRTQQLNRILGRETVWK